MKALRAQLALSGEAFAALLNQAARRHRWPASYTKSKISLMESEKRDLSPEDLAVLEEVDPEHRGWRWFAFGHRMPLVDLIDPERDRRLIRQEEQRAVRVAGKERDAAAKKTRKRRPGSA